MSGRVAAIALAAMLAAFACGGGSSNRGTERSGGTLLLASTTTTQDSGLLDALIPAFEKESGYKVKLISGGSGQAIQSGARGDVDVLLVHSPEAEKRMVDAGDGIERQLVMHNDFVVAGPKGDPAGVKAGSDISAALRAIAQRKATFVSRGDDSGTNVFELKLWRAIGVDPKGQAWYLETGQGQGATLQVASQRQAYALADRGTFLAQRANLDLEIVSQGSPGPLNVYHVIVVNPAKHPNVNVVAARAWAAWITRPDIQELIGQFGVEKFGEPLFVPDAGKAEPAD